MGKGTGGKCKGPEVSGGKGKDPQGAVGPKGVGKLAVGDWKAKAAERKALEEVEARRREPWTRLKVTLLPAGPLDQPRWATAFAATIPDEGSTRSVIFVATFAGSYCIKSSSDSMYEYLATCCMRRCGVPVPDTRLICIHDKEKLDILAALRMVATLELRRGFAEKASKIQGICDSAFSRSELFVTELIPGSQSLKDLGASLAGQWLDFSGDSEAFDALAAHRLQSLGRMWLVDALIGFRDRVSGHPLSPAMENLADARRREAWIASIDNGDNILLAASPPGFYAIDNHWKRVGDSAVENLAGGLEKHQANAVELFSSLCDEQKRCIEGSHAAMFLRQFVKGQTGGREGDAEILMLDTEAIQSNFRNSGGVGGALFEELPPHLLGGKDVGHVLSDAAMTQIRLGILTCLRDVVVDGSGEISADLGRGDYQFVVWLKSKIQELEELQSPQNGSPQSEQWVEQARLINIGSVQKELDVWRSSIVQHAEFLLSLPSCSAVLVPKQVSLDPNLQAEASDIQMQPALWSAIPEDARALLREELKAGLLGA